MISFSSGIINHIKRMENVVSGMVKVYREKYRLLGLRIAYYRKRKGYTQEQLAEKIGMSWSFLSQLEANNGAVTKGMSLNTLFSIADALEISSSELLGDCD